MENIRNKSKMAFIVLKDITGKVQITVEKGENEALDNAVNQITLDSVITVIGKAVESEYVKLGGVEIYPKEIIIESLGRTAADRPRKRARVTSVLRLTSALTTAGSTCAPTRTS